MPLERPDPVGPPDDDDLAPLALLASAIGGRALRVAASERPGATWTDGSVVHLDVRLAERARLESLVIQAALLAAGSLDAAIVRKLRRRPALARRYLAFEAHRALSSVEPILPASMQGLIDRETAARSDSPAASLALARSRAEIAAAPESFGVVRPGALLASIERIERSAAARAQRGDAASDGILAEEGEADDGDALDLFSSPDGAGGPLGRWLANALSVARRLTGGGPPGSEAAARPHLAAPPRGGLGAIHSGTAAAIDDDTGVRSERGTRHPEWDVHRRRYRVDWCTVHEVEPEAKAGDGAGAVDRFGLRRPLARLGTGLDGVHRQPQGADVDIDAAIEARVEQLAGAAPSEEVYVDTLRRRRDLSVLLLLDVSGSAAEPSTTGRTLHDDQRAVAAALVDALHRLGDRVALYGFRSQGRSAVHVLPVKRFEEAHGPRVLRRLHGIEPGAYSRLGAAIRHGAATLRERGATSRRLLVVLSDGLAYDHGYEPDYGAADARRALAEARSQGMGCLCLSIGGGSDAAALRRVFGSAAHATVPRPDRLGQAIGPLFRSALRSAEVRRRVA